MRELEEERVQLKKQLQELSAAHAAKDAEFGKLTQKFMDQQADLERRVQMTEEVPRLKAEVDLLNRRLMVADGIWYGQY